MSALSWEDKKKGKGKEKEEERNALGPQLVPLAGKGAVSMDFVTSSHSLNGQKPVKSLPLVPHVLEGSESPPWGGQ